MRATIHHYEATGGPADAVTKALRQLAGSLRRLPGFVTFLAIQEADGSHLTISVFEDAMSQAAAARQIAAWTTCQSRELGIAQETVSDGELVVQRGL